MELLYDRLDYCFLADILKRNKLAREALVYLVDFKRHKNLEIKFKKHSIEIFNDDVSVSIFMFLGFENSEYLEIKKKPNFYIVCFNFYSLKVNKNKNFVQNLKWLDKNTWFYALLEFSDDRICQDLRGIKNLNLN
ncbi:hypothetical protein K8354_17945 [Polaribacter litorisediminis]|uniref:hypothetical protein n=1 Tax=Polaribacter litorisediminis TaxID=1908341 RepID=UPI001CBB1ABE|nr:hypothetical protein [Polaribacter litorisediminis]UAM98134.1 hypothetical protein K8354_17945 [Polaribacter litorisediminis]